MASRLARPATASSIANEVLLVHRRGVLRAEKILQERLFANKKIDVLWNNELHRVLGHDDPRSVTGAELKSTLTGEMITLPIDGIFIAIGHEPQSELFKGQLDMKPSGYILTAPRTTETSVPGVFAAGDVADDVYRQAVTAAGLGCMAALDAEKHLAGLDILAEAAE
jgi:thioredoxin reductase (NADPH)